MAGSYTGRVVKLAVRNYTPNEVRVRTGTRGGVKAVAGQPAQAQLTVPAEIWQAFPPERLRDLWFRAELTDEGILFRPVSEIQPATDVPEWMKRLQETSAPDRSVDSDPQGSDSLTPNQSQRPSVGRESLGSND
jgi:hypothetical protein